MPHDEVETSEFYKHIESEGLSEPRRMKQLLTWCATRALGEKPSFASEDSNARLAGILGEYWCWCIADQSDSAGDTESTPERLLETVRALGLVQQSMS